MICKLRKQMDLSQNSLGDALSLSASAIGMYEQNRRLPDTDTIIKMCKFFRVSSDYLLEVSDENKKYNDSLSSESIQTRLLSLMKDKDMETEFVASVTKIRKRRLEDILFQEKKPDANELIELADCFNESTDYILILTDDHISPSVHKYDQDSFYGRLNNFMDGYSELEVAASIGVPVYQLKNIIDGTEEPTATILCKLANFFKTSTDYLLAITSVQRKPTSNGTYPFETDETSIDRISSILSNDVESTMTDMLSITDEELYNLKKYGFIPHISVLRNLCKAFNISSDYLLGIADKQDENFLKSFRDLKDDNKDIIIGEIKKLLKEQRYEDSVAAESTLREAK